jgi:hypothetical protein
LTNFISFSPKVTITVSEHGLPIAKRTTTDCVTLISLWTDEGWRRRATKVALVWPRKIYNRRAYDNVHYVPVLAA